jgi:hypothetical protein
MSQPPTQTGEESLVFPYAEQVVVTPDVDFVSHECGDGTARFPERECAYRLIGIGGPEHVRNTLQVDHIDEVVDEDR